MQKLLRAVSEHDRGIAKKKEQLGEIASSQEGDIKEVLLRIVSEVEELKSINRLEEQRTEIERLREELRKVKKEANIDPLTGLRNRRSFERALSEFFRDFKRT